MARKDMKKRPTFSKNEISLPVADVDPRRLPVVLPHSTDTSTIARMSSKKQRYLDPEADTLTMEKNGTKAIIENATVLISKRPAKFSASTGKLMTYIFELFAEINHTGRGKDKKVQNTEITFTLEGFATRCGIITPDMDQKTKAGHLKEFRKKVNRDLYTLMSLKYESRVKFEEKKSSSVVSAKKLINIFEMLETAETEKTFSVRGVYKIKVTPSAAEILIHSPLTCLPQNFYLVDERNKTAFDLIQILSAQYSKTNNYPATYDRLKISTILNSLDLPAYETVTRQGWRRMISEPVLNALKYLKEIGCLREYLITTKKIDSRNLQELAADDENIEVFDEFDDFKNATLYFELQQIPSHLIDYSKPDDTK